MFFLELSNAYSRLAGEKLSMRLLGLDQSWSLIHAAIEGLNNMSVANYSRIVYEVAKDAAAFALHPIMTWIISCAAHTMKRTTTNIKELALDEHIAKYAALCFSLLLNSKTLAEMTTYYQAICIVFMSPSESDDFITAKQLIDAALNDDKRDNPVYGEGELKVHKQPTAEHELKEEEDQRLYELEFADSTIKNASPLSQTVESSACAIHQLDGD